ncbi:hypothetical protein N658DRAFT_516223 [Parathielavia hyrcaniae]|uniref:Uncharacterized protein n=1 Tax=Parathielavia hyrcaniae TaxID=113614 RepID=A0AAN6Q549_9PEZI|nr:hypothetical protein N658DRAFT_516223 [Parathielavia hyrcaniae]
MEEERTITLDLGSSPDPLIDPVLSPPMMPPSYIKKTSQAAERLFTVLAPSPRKQTFELDVGNGGSPQRLLVTVEAGEEGTRNTSRRLFQSPTPKRRVTPRRDTAVTTTTVPLRGLSDDEGPGPSSATPRRRARPRKSGTPIAARRKRPGTPAKGHKDTARTSLSPQKDVFTSDIGFETTPRPSSQSRRVAKRKASSPAKEDGAPSSQPRKRGRPRKQTTTDGDATRLDQEDTPKPEARNGGSFAPDQGDQRVHDMEDDIWLATMSTQPTPVARGQQRLYDTDYTARDRHVLEPEPQLLRHGLGDQPHYDWPDVGGGADSYSDTGSLESEQHSDKVLDNTVMAEEFTMISIGSLPSMQPNSSVMAPAHEELGEATSMIINGALESLRQSQNRPTEEVVEAQSTGDQVIEHPAQPNKELSLPPPSAPPSRRQSPRRAKAQPLARQLAEKSLHQEERQSPAPPQPPVNAEPQEASAYDDSFSEIPEAVLVAATPRRCRQPQPETEEPDEDIQPSIERPSRVNYSNPQSETNRLLTPDETPSPIQSGTGDHNFQTHLSRPAAHADLPPSRPTESPVYPGDAILQHIRRNSTETPADQLSSFTSSNTGARDVLPVHLPVPNQHRPSLSPIVRAGRALQNITSDPPSPPGRDSVLRSPFRGSISKSSQSPAHHAPPDRGTRSPSQTRVGAVTQSPLRTWLAPLSHMKDFIVRSAQSLSPARFPISVTERMDDPFGPDPGELAGSGSAIGRSEARDEDIHTAAFLELSEVDAFEEGGGVEEEEEDEDIWMAIGDQRPTPYAPRHVPATTEPLPGSPRRSKIPSPDELEQQSDQNAHFERDGPVTKKEEPRRPAQARVRQAAVQYSLLSQHPPGHGLAPSHPPTKKPDLSAFFSSPAVLPDMEQPPGLVSSKKLGSRAPGLPKPQAAPYLQAQSQTQLPPVPQKQLDIGSHRRRVDLFSPPASSMAHSNSSPQHGELARPDHIPQQMHFLPPQRQASNTETAAAAADDEIRPPPIPQKMNFTPLRRQSNSTLFHSKPIAPASALFGNDEVSDFFSQFHSHHQHSGAPPREEEDEEEESSLIERPLKPLPDRAASPAKSCIRSPLKAKTPGRIVEFTSSTLSPLAQAQVRAARRASMSPEKENGQRASSGRGQVINGGVAVAEDREVHRFSLEHSLSPSPSPSHEQQPQQQYPQLASHTSHPLPSSTTTTNISSIPPQPQHATQQTQQPQQLSLTTWTRAHWLRLDELLQARKSGTLALELEVARRRRGTGTTASTSSCQHLLGKMVTAQGESMALREWHLDVVEAFLAEVGGIGYSSSSGHSGGGGAGQGQRVFALLVGEERGGGGGGPARR